MATDFWDSIEKLSTPRPSSEIKTPDEGMIIVYTNEDGQLVYKDSKGKVKPIT